MLPDRYKTRMGEDGTISGLEGSHEMATKHLSILLVLAVLVGCRGNPLGGRDEVARQAIAEYVKRGEDAIPELVSLTKSNDLLVRARAQDALGKITGQWGSSGDGLVWKRSVAEAINPDKPLLVLHLFGNFDEEFC